MSGGDEDDKPTVVLDLNALKKQKLKAEEDLANIGLELEFNVPPEGQPTAVDSEDFAEQFLEQREKAAATSAPKPVPKAAASAGQFPVILFDFGSNFFAESKAQFPKGFDYKIIKTLPELNSILKAKHFQIVVFNYDANPKAVNQLSAQIRAKKPTTKTIIIARAISAEKAKLHAKTPSGAAGYMSHPLDAAKIESEFKKIYSSVKN